jgi:glycosyltransferase involved in cell wall biosynthesis
VLSVIIPSRLGRIPRAAGPWTYWLERSVASVRAQATNLEIEIIVGVDRGCVPPVELSGVDVVESHGAGQAAAMNAAARGAKGDLIAFLEDDDVWSPEKTGVQIGLLDQYDLITCNQIEVDLAGGEVGNSDFPTPSGWLMMRRVWETIGEFDEGVRFHIDNEWLGRVNAAGLRRCHVVALSAARRSNQRNLGRVGRRSEIRAFPTLARPLVERTINPKGGMSTIARDRAAAKASRRDFDLCISRYGEVPW